MRMLSPPSPWPTASRRQYARPASASQQLPGRRVSLSRWPPLCSPRRQSYAAGRCQGYYASESGSVSCRTSFSGEHSGHLFAVYSSGGTQIPISHPDFSGCCATTTCGLSDGMDSVNCFCSCPSPLASGANFFFACTVFSISELPIRSGDGQ